MFFGLRNNACCKAPSCEATISESSSLCPSLKVLVEQGDGAHSLEELLEEVALVRGVDGVPFEAEAH